MTTFQPGQTVRFHTPAEPCEVGATFLVVEMRGDRVLVERMDCPHMAIIPTTVYRVADLEAV